MTNTHFKVEEIFADITSKESFFPEQLDKLNKFLAKLL